jgi:hypothetical protein
MKHLGSILHYNFFKSLTELWIFDRYGNIIEKRETMPYIGSKQRKKTNPSSQFDNIKLVQN